MVDGRPFSPASFVFRSSLVSLIRRHRTEIALAVTALSFSFAAAPAFAGIEEAVKAMQAKDMATAEKELQLLVKERDPRAQFLLGFYVYGNPESKLFDLTKAAPLLLDAAERGYTPAIIPLAGAYAEGKGVTHVNLLRTIEAMYGLPKAGKQQEHAAAGGITDDYIITDIFTP